MRWVDSLRLRLRSLFRRGPLEDELDEEFRYHLDRLIEENAARGVPPAEARAAALKEMGGIEQSKEECRDARGSRWLNDLTQDVQFGLRGFVKAPSFSLVVVTSLALGIGVNTAIFSVVNALLLRPLPYRSPERLVWIDEQDRVTGMTGVLDVTFVDWSARARTLEALAGYSNADVTLTGIAEAEQLRGLAVSGGFFPALGVAMVHGRNFVEAELSYGGERAVILGHELWRRRFASDPAVVGRMLRLNDNEHRVVGVLPPDFRFLLARDLWLPLAFDDAKNLRAASGHQLLDVIARLAPGFTRAQAAAELQAIKLSHPWDSEYTKWRTRVAPLQDQLLGGGRRFVLILAGAVLLVLLIACANVANLLLVRGLVRQRQLAIQTALGAGPSRLLRQLLAESLLLALAGGVAGLVLAWSLTRALAAIGPPPSFGDVARVVTIDVDARVLLFTLVVSLVSGLLFGIAPALQFSRPDLTRSLKQGGRGGAPRQQLRQLLLVAQVALTVVLLIGAGLLVRSFANLFAVDLGFRAENLLTARFRLAGERYREPARRTEFQRELLEKVASLPGVESAGIVTNAPLVGVSTSTAISLDGHQRGRADLGLASPAYLPTMGIRLRRGRFFDDRDAHDAAPVIIANDSAARLLSPTRDALGRQFPMPFFKTPATVVGIIEDVRRRGLDQPARPELLVPYPQMAWPFMTLVVRSTLRPSDLAAAVRTQFQALDRDQPLYDVQTMQERLSESVAPRRFTLMLLGTFALLALLLASVGVYGVTSYLVEQRTHEVGIRRALGARGRDVLRLFLEQGLALGLVGVALGLFGALALTQTIASLLFGVGATDAATYLSVALLMTSIVLAACWLPSRRALGVDSLVALRHE